MAREAVRLPYEHQGQAKQYQTEDFRDYLPTAAGGYAAGQHAQDIDAVAAAAASAAAPSAPEVSRLGHILYVRDSEEEHDSDEDPDDDLDI